MGSKARSNGRFPCALAHTALESKVQAVNGTYGASWLTPTLIPSARLAKVTLQVDF